MNESTNIVTVRHYQDGSILVTVNGRDIPDVIQLQGSNGTMQLDRNGVMHTLPDGTKTVTMEFRVAQFNILQGDADEPEYLKAAAPVAPPKRTWSQAIRRWLMRR